MSAHSLSKRLSYIRGTGDSPKKRAKKPAGRGENAIPVHDVPSGWKKTGDYTYVRDYRIKERAPALFQTAALLGGDLEAENCIFFDTETTGLSGGAGTIAFLIGTGRFRAGVLQVRQYFLADFPGEREMLSLLREELRDDAWYVSYNGRAFDSHLLRSRFAFHGMEADFPVQADLLYPARRLWKSKLESCALSVVEEKILGVSRVGDLPGREVPEYYFSFLKTGSFPLLEGVFRHNKQDILSLFKLLKYYHRICRNPSADDLYDPLGFGKVLLEKGDMRGRDIIEEAFQKGREDAGIFLSMYYKRTGRYAEALVIWETLWKQRLAFAGLELAKYHEHKTREYSKALTVVESLLSSGELPRDALNYRRKRLLAKIARASDGLP